MEWIVLTGLVLNATGAFLLLASDIPETGFKRRLYGLFPTLRETDEIVSKLAREWKNADGDAYRFRSLSDREMKIVHSVVHERSLDSLESQIEAMRYESPYLIFDRADGPGFMTPCYTSPRRLFERRLERAISIHFTRLGAVALLIGFSIQIASYLV